MTVTAPAAHAPVGSDDLLRCVDPATGELLGEVAAHTPAQVRAMVEAARRAQASWSASPFALRKKLLGGILENLLERADDVVDAIVRDAGKTRENAILGELWPVAEKIRWTVDQGEALLADEPVPSGLFVHKRARIEYDPRGVIGIIAPWNYPLQNILGPAIPALYAGNAVIVKVSEHVAWSAERFRPLWEDVLTELGLPPALLQIVHGDGRAGEALIQAGVELIVFTGSMGNGKRVLRTSAETLTPTILELGGKDAMIVCDDANLEAAAHAALAGSFIAAGQNCLAAERTLVHAKVHDAFVARIKELAGQLRLGVPHRSPGEVDVGALVTPHQREIVKALVDDAIAKGAEAIVGGDVSVAPRGGNFFPPTVLAGCTPDMAVMQEETFGPVMAICRVHDDDEAVRVANGTAYGLGLTVFTGDPERGRRISRRVQTGGASINDFGFTYMVQGLPFGGLKGSGFGRLNGREGLRACTQQKAVLEDRVNLGIPAKLYPVGRGDYGRTRGVLRTLYGQSARQRLAGLRDLLGL
ncbi:MAG: aldehyde dehydrogenase family protein [Myxococcota bacterium]